MKKNIMFMLGVCLLTASCASTGGDVANLSTMGKMKNCLSEQAMQSLTNGTLYANGVSATAKEISNTCIKSLAMEHLGIDTQTTQMATTILSALKASNPQ